MKFLLVYQTLQNTFSKKMHLFLVLLIKFYARVEENLGKLAILGTVSFNNCFVTLLSCLKKTTKKNTDIPGG